MPIRFRCHHCGQKLRVGDDKVALRAKCPRCQQLLVVPSASTEADEGSAPPAEPATGAVEPPPLPGAAPANVPAPEAISAPAAPALPEIVIQEDAVEWVYETEPLARDRTPPVDKGMITLPRRVLFVQGVLLGVVALLSFLLGFAVRGSRTARQPAMDLPQPCTLTGTVTYVGAGREQPDAGSVVIAVPLNQRPPADRKAAVAGLRPGDPDPLPDNASLRLIRSLGGDYTRVGEQGAFRLRVSDKGEYFLLVISAHARRPVEEPPEKRDVAQIGRYFQSPLDLLAEQRYHWSPLVVRRDLTQDIPF